MKRPKQKMKVIKDRMYMTKKGTFVHVIVSKPIEKRKRKKK